MTDDLPTLYADSHSQTADMHPADIAVEATAYQCIHHPEEGFTSGVGYAGGGFGQYKRCKVCNRVFGKTPLKDGNQ